MDIETISKLLDAGYTKDEISKLQTVDNAGGEADESAGKDNATESEKQSNAGAENESEINNVNDVLKTLTETVNGLTATVKAMQDANANGAATTSPKSTDKVIEAMQSFIDTL